MRRGLLRRVGAPGARAAARRPGAPSTFVPSRERRLEAPVERGSQRRRASRLPSPGAAARLPRCRVVHDRSASVAAALREIALAQEAPRVARAPATAGRSARARSRVDEPSRDEHLRHRRARAPRRCRAYGDPQVGVDRAWRCSRARSRRAGALVARLRAGSARSGSACRPGCTPQTRISPRRTSRRPSRSKTNLPKVSAAPGGTSPISVFMSRVVESSRTREAASAPAVCVPRRHARAEVPDRRGRCPP